MYTIFRNFMGGRITQPYNIDELLLKDQVSKRRINCTEVDSDEEMSNDSSDPFFPPKPRHVPQFGEGGVRVRTVEPRETVEVGRGGRGSVSQTVERGSQVRAV